MGGGSKRLKVFEREREREREREGMIWTLEERVEREAREKGNFFFKQFGTYRSTNRMV